MIIICADPVIRIKRRQTAFLFLTFYQIFYKQVAVVKACLMAGDITVAGKVRNFSGSRDQGLRLFAEGISVIDSAAWILIYSSSYLFLHIFIV